MNAEAKKPAKVKVNSAPKKRKKVASLEKKKARIGYLFVLPFIIGLVIIYLPMIYQSISYSFQSMTTIQGGGVKITPVGWANYQNAIMVDPTFTQTLIQGMGRIIFDVPAIVIFSLFMAILLNQDMAGRGLFRAIFFIPVIISTGLITDIDSHNILMQSAGQAIDTGTETSTVTQIVNVMDIEMLFANMKVGSELVTYVADLVNDIFNIVNRSGVQMLIFLAGLQSISPAIYESCEIDGATGWETFWKITFPMISPMILVNAIYTIIDALTRSDNTVMAYIDTVYNQPGGNTLSAAMSWMYFLLVILLIAVVSGVISAYVFYQKRDT